MLKTESRDVLTKFKYIYIDNALVIGLSAEVDKSKKVSNGISKIVYDEDLYLDNKEDIISEINNFQSELFLIEDEIRLDNETNAEE